MNRKRITQAVLSILAIPLISGATLVVITATPFIGGVHVNKASAQSPESPAEPEQPAPESPESPAEPAAPAEAAKAETESNTNWLLIGGGIVATLVIIAIISSLSGRRRHDV